MKSDNKYALPSEIDLTSKFLRDVEVKRLAKIEAEKQLELMVELQERIALERLDDDVDHGKRLHAWVVILSNVDWAAKKTIDDASKDSDEIRPLFIEATTGQRVSMDDVGYLGIESIWNNHNYYVSVWRRGFSVKMKIIFRMDLGELSGANCEWDGRYEVGSFRFDEMAMFARLQSDGRVVE